MSGYVETLSGRAQNAISELWAGSDRSDEVQKAADTASKAVAALARLVKQRSPVDDSL